MVDLFQVGDLISQTRQDGSLTGRFYAILEKKMFVTMISQDKYLFCKISLDSKKSLRDSHFKFSGNVKNS